MEENYVYDDRYARFAELYELEREFSTNYIGEDTESGGGPPFFVDLEASRWITGNTDSHCIVLGSTGSGKTLSVLLPTILSDADAGRALVINDPKGEEYDKISGRLASKGYRLVVLNFRDTDVSCHYNPFQIAIDAWKKGKNSKAIDIMKDLLKLVFKTVSSQKDPFWERAALDYAMALGTILLHEEPDALSFKAIQELHIQGVEKVGPESALKGYLEEKKEELPEVYRLAIETVEAPRETKSSIHSVFNTGLGAVNFNEDVAHMMSKSDFSPKEFGKEKIALFLISPDESSAMSTCLALIIKSIYMALTDAAYESGSERLHRGVDFLLDEFGNLSPIEDFTNMITEARSRNVRFLLCLQDFAQLERVYGKEEAAVIKSNCAMLFYLHSSSIAVRKEISELCGNMLLAYTNQVVPLLTPEQLGSFEKGQCLIFANRRPYITYLPFIFKYEKYGCLKLGSVPMKKRDRSEPLKRFDLVKQMSRREQEKLKSLLETMDERINRMKKEETQSTKKDKREDDEEKVINIEDYVYRMEEFEDAFIFSEQTDPEEDADLLEDIFCEFFSGLNRDERSSENEEGGV